MGDEVLRLYKAAMLLPDIDRAELAAMLSESLSGGPSQEQIDASWIAEAKRRLEDVRAGRLETVSHQEVIRRARAAIEQAKLAQAG